MKQKIRLMFMVVLIFVIMVASIQLKVEASIQWKENTEESLFLQTSIITHHWHEEFNNDPDLISIEYHPEGTLFYGIAGFENSFYQPSWYVYAGKTYSIASKGDIKIRSKITAGIIHGYDDEDGKYDVLITRLKTFPILIPTIGIAYKRLEFDIFPLANEGIMVTTGIRF